MLRSGERTVITGARANKLKGGRCFSEKDKALKKYNKKIRKRDG
jgi:hypothetical protein